LAVCSALLVVAPSPAAADEDPVPLLVDAFDALMAGDDAGYEEALTALRAADTWLPDRTWEALEDRDDSRIALSWTLLGATEEELLLLVLDRISLERDALHLASSGAAVDRLYAYRVDSDGELALEVIDKRGVDIKDATRALLGPFTTDLAVELPSMPGYEDVIGVLAGRLGVTLPPAAFTSYNDATAPTGAVALSDVTGAIDPTPERSPAGTTPNSVALGAVAALGLVVSLVAWGRGRRNRVLADLAFTDALTGLHNRRRFDSDLAARIGECGRPTAVLMLDVDHFKKFNDTHGHAVGDEVLRRVGEVIAGQVRPDDVAYRYGGEEFSVLLTDCTIEDAHAVGLRLGEAIRDLRIDLDADTSVSITASLGLAIGLAEDAVDLLEQADRAMYSAKEAGRDRLVVG